MSSIRIITLDLLNILDDLAATASHEAGLAGYAGVLLHSDRIAHPTEPGAINVLVGTSTTGSAIGHTWREAGGTLNPTLWPIQYVNALRVSLAKLLTKDNRDSHVTQIDLDGDQVTIAEDPDLFGGGFTQTFTGGDLKDFPPSTFTVLAEVQITPPAELDAVENRTDFAAAYLAPFLAIAKRRGGILQTYRVHQQLPVRIQIGGQYLGVVAPAPWDPTADGAAPDLDVHPADLPEVVEPEETTVGVAGGEDRG